MTTPLRPPFVWTPKQEIDPTGGRHVYLGGGGRPTEKNRWFFFRKRVDLPAKPVAAPTSITVDGRYVLHVNGKAIGRGPVRCTPLFQRYDDYDLAPHLAAGANVLAVLVHTYGTDTAFYETVKGMWQPVFGDGGLWVDGAAEGVSLTTDGGWRCTQSNAWTQDVPQSNHSLGFIEDLDAARLIEGWTDVDFDDSGWDDARPLIFGGGGAEAAYGGMQTRPFPTLVPRGIPMLEERLEPAKRVIWIKGLYPDPDLVFHRRAYDEPLIQRRQANAVTHADDLLRLEGAQASRAHRAWARCRHPARFRPHHDGAAVHRGFEARGGRSVEIACAEGLPHEWDAGGPPPDAHASSRSPGSARTLLCALPRRGRRAAVRAVRVVRDPLGAARGP